MMIAVAIGFFGGVLLTIIAYAGWSANETATNIERQLVVNALDQSIAHALNEQRSVAWCDEPVTKSSDEALDLEFTDANYC